MTYGQDPECVIGDRGFHSKSNHQYLADRRIFNGICPKLVSSLKEALQNTEFLDHQRRRAQTEGRIGIIQNVFLGDPFRSKGFESRELHVVIAILTHNLWVIARLPKAEEEKIKHRQVA